jgi:hypothetical protein
MWWLFLAVAALAWKENDERGRYARVSAVCAAGAVGALLLGWLAGDGGGDGNFADVEDMGEDTFLGALAA